MYHELQKFVCTIFPKYFVPVFTVKFTEQLMGFVLFVVLQIFIDHLYYKFSANRLPEGTPHSYLLEALSGSYGRWKDYVIVLAPYLSHLNEHLPIQKSFSAGKLHML